MLDRVNISFDHSSHARKTQVKIHHHEWGQKVDGHYKIQSCTQKTDKFPGIEQSSVFERYYQYARCFSSYQLISNIISASLLTKIG